MMAMTTNSSIRCECGSSPGGADEVCCRGIMGSFERWVLVFPASTSVNVPEVGSVAEPGSL